MFSWISSSSQNGDGSRRIDRTTQGKRARPCRRAIASKKFRNAAAAAAFKTCHSEERRISDFSGRRRRGASVRQVASRLHPWKSQRFFDSVPSRLRPQGTALRMTGYDAPLRGNPGFDAFALTLPVAIEWRLLISSRFAPTGGGSDVPRRWMPAEHGFE